MSNEPVAWMHVQGNFEEPSHRQLHEFEIMRGWKQYPLYTRPVDDTALLRQCLEALKKAYGALSDEDEEEVEAVLKAVTALRERLEGKA